MKAVGPGATRIDQPWKLLDAGGPHLNVTNQIQFQARTRKRKGLARTQSAGPFPGSVIRGAWAQLDTRVIVFLAGFIRSKREIPCGTFSGLADPRVGAVGRSGVWCEECAANRS